LRSAEDDDLLGDGDNPQGGDSEMKEAEDPNPNPPNNSTTALTPSKASFSYTGRN
jgi:hypothetical protein